MVFGILVALWKKKLDRAGINKKYGGYDAAYYLETSVISDTSCHLRNEKFHTIIIVTFLSVIRLIIRQFIITNPLSLLKDT